MEVTIDGFIVDFYRDPFAWVATFTTRMLALDICVREIGTWVGHSGAAVLPQNVAVTGAKLWMHALCLAVFP